MGIDHVPVFLAPKTVIVIFVQETARGPLLVERAENGVLPAHLVQLVVCESKIFRNRQRAFQELNLFAQGHDFTPRDSIAIRPSMSSGRNRTMPLIPHRLLSVVDLRRPALTML